MRTFAYLLRGGFEQFMRAHFAVIRLVHAFAEFRGVKKRKLKKRSKQCTVSFLKQRVPLEAGRAFRGYTSMCFFIVLRCFFLLFTQLRSSAAFFLPVSLERTIASRGWRSTLLLVCGSKSRHGCVDAFLQPSSSGGEVMCWSTWECHS